MFEVAVTNASPLIYLGRIDKLHLLERCARDVYVPDVVVHEIQAGGNEPAAQVIGSCTWLTVVSVATVPPLISDWNLGTGESAVLAWAVANRGARAIIDDREGRRCAAQLGVRVVGTLGLILAAKQRGQLVKVRPVVEELIASGFYLSDDIADAALALVGE